MPLPDGTAPEDGASCFVNPLTSLGFVETMKLEGYKAIVHAAAASNLGQMLVKICSRLTEFRWSTSCAATSRLRLLKGIGAEIVLNSNDDDFVEKLDHSHCRKDRGIPWLRSDWWRQACRPDSWEPWKPLRCAGCQAYSRYGSDQMKQVYIYGALDVGPTILNRSFGLTWGLGGWLLTPFMAKAGPEIVGRMRARVAAELTTTFKSHYSHEISLEQASMSRRCRLTTPRKPARNI